NAGEPCNARVTNATDAIGRRSLAGAEPREHQRKLFRADVEVLADPSPQHGRRHVAIAALLLRLMKHVQDDALLMGEPVANVGQDVFERVHCAYDSTSACPS